MTQSIRDAAQALIDAYAETGPYRHLHISTARVALKDALSAPQPTADERVAEHMRLVESAADDWAGFILHGSDHLKLSEASFSAVEQSARALLSASQEDAEHAAMYRWMREQIKDEASRVAAQALLWNHNSRMELDAAIRAAMSSKETK